MRKIFAISTLALFLTAMSTPSYAFLDDFLEWLDSGNQGLVQCPGDVDNDPAAYFECKRMSPNEQSMCGCDDGDGGDPSGGDSGDAGDSGDSGDSSGEGDCGSAK